MFSAGAAAATLPLSDFTWNDLAPGTAAPLRLTVPIGLLQPISLPALAVRGAHAGPTAMFVAGVHGDEFEGVAAIHDLLGHLDPAHLTGNILALPVCNPLAYEAQTRQSPDAVDGLNLAREFPGSANGSTTQRLAAALFGATCRLLGPHDLFVDLHSAGARYRYASLAGFRDITGPARSASEEAARRFGGRLWRIADHPGTFNAETTRAGIPTVAAEAPGQGGCRPDDVAWYVDGLQNLLRHLGMVLGDVPPRDGGQAGSPSEIVAGHDGLFRTPLIVGDMVEAGDEIGAIYSEFGQRRESLLAPHAGEIWALRALATTRTGDYLAWVTE